MHKPVLLKEVIDNIAISSNYVLVDATLGNAGHATAILESDISNIIFLGIDADENAIKIAQENLKSFSKSHHILFEKSYFDSLGDILDKNQISKIDRILFDLGFRSDQVDNPERGFSINKEGPLLMTFGTPTEKDLTAEIIVNEFSEESLANVIYAYGEETAARRIAKAIVNYRSNKRITTTTELAEIVKKAVPFFRQKGKIHPATKTFQALRIAVNKELERLEKVLPIAFERLNPKGRILVITFHSLEDRIVKNFFKEKFSAGKAKLINKKPITATESEILENPRARSAKLRILEKTQ